VSSSAETALLKERARLLARPVAPLVTTASRSVLTFSLGDERYALDTRFVHTVQRMCAVFPLPGAAAHVLGLTSAHGELLVVFDLRVLLGIARPAHSPASRMLVLGEKQPELVVIADALHEVRELHDIELFDLPASIAERERPYLCGVTGEAISLFDGSALLSDPQLYVDETGANLPP
jgi:purine-binding chemotaxis protein CheW